MSWENSPRQTKMAGPFLSTPYALNPYLEHSPTLAIFLIYIKMVTPNAGKIKANDFHCPEPHLRQTLLTLGCCQAPNEQKKG